MCLGSKGCGKIGESDPIGPLVEKGFGVVDLAQRSRNLYKRPLWQAGYEKRYHENITVDV